MQRGRFCGSEQQLKLAIVVVGPQRMQFLQNDNLW